MAAGAQGRGRRQVSVEVGIKSSGDVRFEVCPPSRLRVHEIEAAVDDAEIWPPTQQCPQRVHVDQGLEHHDSELTATIDPMALTLYWGSGSPFSWRVLLALEHKQLPYESQVLHFDKQEHQSPQMLKMNPRS